MKKEIRQFIDSMKLIDWQPHIAAFQLSDNLIYARHSDWLFIPPEKKKDIENDIWGEWHLVKIWETPGYAYFGPLWERTRILNFYPENI